jgi:hypothetical protein
LGFDGVRINRNILNNSTGNIIGIILINPNPPHHAGTYSALRLAGRALINSAVAIVVDVVARYFLWGWAAGLAG